MNDLFTFDLLNGGGSDYWLCDYKFLLKSKDCLSDRVVIFTFLVVGLLSEGLAVLGLF
jgi:hypothetical protein